MKILIKNTLLFLLLFAGGYPLGQCAILGITDSPWYLLLCVPFLYVAKSASMPFLCGIGVFRHHSPMLLSVMSSSKKVIELHSGGIVDMIPIVRLKDAGFNWRRKTFAYFLEGLLNLIKELKANGADGYRIEGTSYFLIVQPRLCKIGLGR